MAKDPADQFNREDQDPAGDPEGTYIPPDEPLGAQSYGTTANEERQGEGFDRRSRHLQAEDSGNPGYDEYATGQLVQPGDEEVDAQDTESNVIAIDVGRNWDGDLSAEEAAMHVVDDNS